MTVLTTNPWDFQQRSFYKQAQTLAPVDPQSLDEKTFLREYVHKNRPCLLPGAIRHWEAFKSWDPQWLIDRCGMDMPVKVCTEPAVEEQGFETDNKKQLLDDYLKRYKLTPMTFAAFLDAATDPNGGYMAMHSQPLSPEAPLGKLIQDLGDFSFLAPPTPKFIYPKFGAFFYAGSYTDWHFHPANDAFMSQVRGTKEVLLLPPDPTTWSALQPVMADNLWSYAAKETPELAALRPIRVLVEPGDTLFIPLNWWHCVAPVDNAFGITVARWFPSRWSDVFNFNQPATRVLLKNAMRISPLVPLLLSPLITYGYLKSVVPGRGNRRHHPAAVNDPD